MTDDGFEIDRRDLISITGGSAFLSAFGVSKVSALSFGPILLDHDGTIPPETGVEILVEMNTTEPVFVGFDLFPSEIPPSASGGGGRIALFADEEDPFGVPSEYVPVEPPDSSSYDRYVFFGSRDSASTGTIVVPATDADEGDKINIVSWVAGTDGFIESSVEVSSEKGTDIDADDITIEFENEFGTGDTESHLESLFGTISEAMPVTSPTEPDKNEAYIHVDVRVELSDDVADSVESIRPILTHDKTDQEFSPSGLEHLTKDIDEIDFEERENLNQLAPDVYGWDDFRGRAPEQVGIQGIEGILTLISAGSAAEVPNPVRAKTEAYPDVRITALEIEKSDGSETRVDVDERIPRYNDACLQTPGPNIPSLFNDGCPTAGGSNPNPYTGNMVLSPATIAIEDSQGRITGRVWENGEYVEYDQIPDAIYSGKLRHEFVIAPDDNYRVIVDGEDSGTATVITDTADGGTVRTNRYQDVAVDSSTRLEIPPGEDNLRINQFRNGNADDEISPTKTTNTPTEFIESRSGGNSPLNDYRNQNGKIDTSGLQEAINDFIQGDIGTGTLQSVINAFI